MKSLKQRITEMDQLVMELGEISQEDLAEIRYHAAIQYLDRVVGNALPDIDKNPDFWKHWRLCWYHMDRQILEGDDERPPIIRFDLRMMEYCYQAESGAEVRLVNSWQFRKIYLRLHEADPRYKLNSILTRWKP